MNHSRHRGPNNSAIERMLRDLMVGQRFILRALNVTIELENIQMADFKELADNVAKIKGTVASTKSFIQGLKAKIEELAAGMDDGPDQAAVVALAAELGSTESELAAAIAANSGGSVAGNNEPA